MCQDVGMAEVVRPYRGVAAETRRELRRGQLLDACLDVVGAVGVADTTAEAVAARAGLSKRYFYESFRDREGALVAALEHVFDAVRAAIVTDLATTGDEVEQRATRTVAALVRTLSADRRAARLFVEAPRHPALEARRNVAFDEFSQLLMGQVLAIEPGSVRGRLVTLFIVAGTTEVLSRWLAGDLDLDEHDVVREIATIGISAASRFSAEPTRR